MRPIIGLTGVYECESGFVKVRNAYMEHIYNSGGMPVLLPLFFKREEIENIADLFSGFLFTGGGDVSPSYYGETLQTPEDNTEPLRDAFELALFRCAEIRQKPMLGICRGAQLFAVACGAKLRQVVSHHSGGISHEVAIKKDGLLEKICGESRLMVNSFHCQAVAEISSAVPLDICAKAKDGTIEAIAHKTLPFCLGVQWHPERMPYGATGSDDVISAFVSACVSRD